MSAIITPGTGASVQSSSSGVSWGSIIAGAVAAAAISLILLLVGSGIGLASVSPWGDNPGATALGVGAAIWIVIIQWFSAGVGGYITGRLRTKWSGIHTHEALFRDTAHGFLSWAVATLFVAAFLGSAVTSVIGAGAQATASLAGAAGGAGAAAASKASSSQSDMPGGFSPAYFTDSLLRPAAGRTAPQAASDEQVSAEVTRILVNGVTQGQIPADDKTYLQQVVASRTGLSEADAGTRVNQVLKQIDDAKTAAKQAADKARKTASTTSLLLALSLFVGAFIGAVAGTLGGRQRDENDDLVARI